MRGLRYADSSQTKNPLTEPSGWTRRKTGYGYACRKRGFAARLGKNRFRHLGKFAGAVGKMLISFGVGKSRMKKYDRCRRVLRAKYPLFDLDAAMPRIASRLVLV